MGNRAPPAHPPAMWGRFLAPEASGRDSPGGARSFSAGEERGGTRLGWGTRRPSRRLGTPPPLPSLLRPAFPAAAARPPAPFPPAASSGPGG